MIRGEGARWLGVPCFLLLSACSRCDAGKGDPERAFESCGEPGVVHSATRRLERAGRRLDVQAELVAAGCGGRGPSLVVKAPAGAPCTHQSACSSVNCACPSGPATFLARACVDGRCAGRDEACSLAPAAVGRSACR